MDALDALLSAETKIEKEVFIKRLNVNFLVKAIDGKTLNGLKEQATHYVGKGANRKKEFDEDEFNGLLVAEACLSPDFNNAKLLEKYGASDGGECVHKALLAGETINLQETILRLSGFSDNVEDFEEIKN
jgi:hypothetical protein